MLRRSKSFWTGTVWRASLVAALVASLSLAAVATAAPDSQDGPGRQPRQARARPAGKLTYVWLWYADGKAMPEFSEDFCNYIPPVYKCNFGSSVDDCKAQVQTYLDAWYADFNVVFTFTRPPSGDYYTYKVVITSGWPQCKLDAADLTGGIAANEGGIAPSNNCLDNPGHTAIAIECGNNAHDCATIIAHEHGHLVGLIHATSSLDVMNPSVRSTAAGFLDQSLPIVQDMANACGLDKQNSYRTMLATLGAWPGGTKPGLTTTSDAGAPDAAPNDAQDARSLDVPDASAIGSVFGSGAGPSVDGNLAVLAEIDAYARTPPPAIPDDGPATPTTTTKKGGCDFTRTSTSPSLLLVAGLLFGYRLLSRKRALSRAVSRARGSAPRRAQARDFLA
jgi:hypothetical protein